MEPTKYPLNGEDSAWSKRLESVRKDVECFFGILNGRFRLLRLPIIFRSKRRIDNVFFTCTILHNMLHTYDGMDTLGEGVQWTGDDVLAGHRRAAPNADSSLAGEQQEEDNESLEVHPSHDELKRSLIESFTYRNNVLNDILWLR